MSNKCCNFATRNVYLGAMKKIVMLFVLVCVGLSAYAINYPTYKPSKLDREAAAQQQMQQAAAVQSAAAQQEESMTPMLNEDGTAVHPYTEAPAQAAAGPRRNTVPNPPGDDDENFIDPIGSVWVLLLLAGGYAATTAYRRRREIRG